MTRDELAIQTLRIYKGPVRLSNKAGGGWWCYLGDIIVQAPDPTEAILGAWAKYLQPKTILRIDPNSGMIPWPDAWTDYHYNACNDPCDMLVGPCACGATHNITEKWVLSKLITHKAEIV